MTTITQPVCGVIPPHILDRVAQRSDAAADDARSTLEQMRELARERTLTFIAAQTAAGPAAPASKKRRNVYDGQHHGQLPGKLVMSEHKPRSADVDVQEAYEGSGATYDFYSLVFSRNSIDDRGMRLDSTVHYSRRFDNAMWNGRQMVYGDGDGRLFRRFTASLDVIGHELTHGVTQYAAALGYSGQTGALNEHISDAFGIMVKQFTLRQTARESDWLIGAELFTSAVRGKAVRSMAAPGTAYDDPVLGRDPQPAHMRGYLFTDDDNGGVHINSGIPNHAFYLAAIALGGNSWEALGNIWYETLTQRLAPDAGFSDFASATVDVAGELFGTGSRVREIVADAWSSVGILTKAFAGWQPSSTARPLDRPSAPQTTNIRKEISIMSTGHTDLEHHNITASISAISRGDMEMENAALADTPNGRVQRLVRLYGSVKPLLLVLTTLVILPQSWRDGIKVFVGALDAVAVVAPQFDPGQIVKIDDPKPAPDFKAGKDLDT